MKAVGQLDHPNIVQATDAGEEKGTHFLVMEFVEGVDLAKLVKVRGPLPLAEACELIRQAALGLHYAHKRGLVHRDIKPQNLMLTPDGQVKILDFGLASVIRKSMANEATTEEESLPSMTNLTQAGVVMGTPDYMAPEQAKNASTADIRSDIYSLGCTFFKLLAGHSPYHDSTFSTPLEKILAHAQKPVPDIRKKRPEVPKDVAGLIKKMLAKNPGDRISSAGKVAEKLKAHVSDANPGRLLEKPGETKITATQNIVMEGSKKSAFHLPKWGVALFLSPFVLGLCALGTFFFLNMSSRGAKTKTAEITPAKKDTKKNPGNKNLPQPPANLSAGQKQVFDHYQQFVEASNSNRRNEVLKTLSAANWNLWQEQAKKGYSEAQYLLAETLLYRRDSDEAFAWGEKAAKTGFLPAIELVGYCYKKGLGVAKNESKGFEYYLKAANKGNAAAQNGIGACYYEGVGVPQNYTKAVHWYQKAAEQGNQYAQRNLARCYFGGSGVEKDYTKAFHWFKKSALLGNIRAQNNVGNCYYNGEGVKKDYAEAVRWYQKSANKGDSYAQSNLGNCYYYGRGVKTNYSEAFKWYKKSADQSNQFGRYGLAMCYEHGRGTPQNIAKALNLYEMNAQAGHSASIEAFKRLTGRGNVTEGFELNTRSNLTRGESKLFSVELNSRYTYQIDLMSTDFDPFLRLLDSSGNTVEVDDDGGNGLNAQLTFRPTSSGTYRIIATSLRRTGSGDFTLTVIRVGGKR